MSTVNASATHSASPARNDWSNSIYPMVPGHEIVAHVIQVGAQVGKLRWRATASSWPR